MKTGTEIKEISHDDIIELLKGKKGGFILRSFHWWPPLQLRAWAFVATLKGYFSIFEFWQLSLPSFFFNKSKMMDRLGLFLNNEFKKEHPALGKNLNLFGHKFALGNFYETISLINDIIVSDQYCANEFLKNDSIVIDAGAHVGTFSVFAARLVPKGKIYSFEPVAGTFENLKSNTEDYTQITCINCGLGDNIGHKNIFVDYNKTLGSFFEDSPLYRKKTNLMKGESADVISIDFFVEKNNIPRVDFIKIDTEGYEAKVLNGAKKTIKKWKPVIVMSAYHNPEDKEILPKILKEICINYTCDLRCTYEEDFICYVKI